jgi:hypothetical protein
MSRIQLIIGSVTFVVTLMFVTPPAEAVQRTHVSAAFGSDTNTASNCTAVAPCRFFQAAMSVTDNNGEVIVLDSGGYGAVTITQSVALIAPTGVYAGISVFPGADGVTIATPGVDVVLRGLSINGQGGNVGIKMIAGNSLTVANSVVSNLTQGGIAVSGAAIVKITDTVVQRNRNSGILLQNGVRATIIRTMVSGHINGDGFDGGIRVQGSIDNTTTTADIADSTFDGNRNGVLALAFAFGGTAVARVSVRDSRAVGNQVFGFRADSNFASAVSLSVSNSLVSSNSIGIGGANAGVKVWASGNTVSHNASSGLFNDNGAVFESAGNNAVRNNGAINSGTITIIATQ